MTNSTRSTLALVGWPAALSGTALVTVAQSRSLRWYVPIAVIFLVLTIGIAVHIRGGGLSRLASSIPAAIAGGQVSLVILLTGATTSALLSGVIVVAGPLAGLLGALALLPRGSADELSVPEAGGVWIGRASASPVVLSFLGLLAVAVPLLLWRWPINGLIVLTFYLATSLPALGGTLVAGPARVVLRGDVGWPVVTIPVETIRDVSVEPIRWVRVRGGWALAAGTFVSNPGDALVMETTNGRRLRVTVDDPQKAMEAIRRTMVGSEHATPPVA